MASVTRMARSGPLARHHRRTISGSVWMPSQMSSAIEVSVVRTVPRMPGSRWSSGRMALKVCVALMAPAAMAARVSAAVALEWPTETRTAACGGVGGEFDGAGQFGRQRHQAHMSMGCVEEAIEGGDVWGEKMFGRLHAALCVREKRAFEMDAEGRARPGCGRLGDLRLQGRQRAQRGIERRGDGGGKEGAGAARGKKGADGVERLRAWLPSRRGRRRRECARRRKQGPRVAPGKSRTRALAGDGVVSRVAMELILPSSMTIRGCWWRLASVPESLCGHYRLHGTPLLQVQSGGSASFRGKIARGDACHRHVTRGASAHLLSFCHANFGVVPDGWRFVDGWSAIVRSADALICPRSKQLIGAGSRQSAAAEQPADVDGDFAGRAVRGHGECRLRNV